jgi:hypothetical protein
LAELQGGGKVGASFAIGTLGRGPPLKKLADMKWVRAIRNKKGGGGRGEGLQRAAHAPVLGVGHDEGIVRAIGLALAHSR